MTQFNTNNSSLTAIPQINDELFFETFTKSQEALTNNLSHRMVKRTEELKYNISMIFNLKKNFESLKSVLSQDNLKYDQFYQQKQYLNDLKLQMEFLLEEMKNYKQYLPVQKKLALIPDHVKRKKRNRKSKKLECKQVKSFIKSKVGKKKPILKDDIENLCRSNHIRLSEVISRKTEAQKFINLLQDVTQLRKVKLANARVEGKVYSDETNAVVEKIINGIKEQWIHLINEYNLEERNLKEIMKDDTSNNSSNTAKLHYWEKILFGDDICRTSYDSLEENLKKYYALLRCMWDDCIDTNEGSNLPLGWVMPQEPSHPTWEEYVKKTSN
ncbi:CAP-Gly domain-containing linker protein 1-like [Phymastichus coffea]|uniref:CAP-Gly domain-containing linker protein 1-like n=1 Tax=Phymastichus coffea TaxID=108790 RepID=UPI00273BFF92|nr:CAP-Gly domain-containing linker protein 1-like [Phymastichus coffea]